MSLAEFPKLETAVAHQCNLVDNCPDGCAVHERLAAAAELLGRMLAWHEEQIRRLGIVAPGYVMAPSEPYTLAARRLEHRESIAWLRAELAKLEAST